MDAKILCLWLIRKENMLSFNPGNLGSFLKVSPFVLSKGGLPCTVEHLYCDFEGITIKKLIIRENALAGKQMFYD